VESFEAKRTLSAKLNFRETIGPRVSAEPMN
jgi:hypothetical protein